MNRSRRRTAVISWAITAGVLYGAVGIVGVAPAAANPAGAGDSRGARDGASGSDRHSNAVGGAPRVRRPGTGIAAGDPVRRRGHPARAAARAASEARPGETVEIGGTVKPDPPTTTESHGTTEPHERHWPCHIIWPIWPIWPVSSMPVPVDGGTTGNAFVAFVNIPAPSLPPPVQFPGLTAPELPGFGLESLSDSSDAGSGLSQTPPAVQSRVDRGAEPAAPPPPAAPLAGGISPPAAPPAAPPPPPPEAGRLGYPEYLRNADFAQVAAVALSGLAGILAVTALGGFVGYRQAKAGFVLRASGTARFLQ